MGLAAAYERYDFDGVAVGERSGGMLGARHKFTVDLDGCGLPGGAERLQERRDGGSAGYFARLAVDGYSQEQPRDL